MPGNEEIIDRSRIEPLVAWLRRWPGQYLIRYEWDQESEEGVRSRAGAAKTGPPIKVFVADLMRFIKPDPAYSDKDRAWVETHLLDSYRKQLQSRGYSFGDFLEGFRLAVDLVSWAALIYDKPEALQRLQKEVPGFSRQLYEQVLGEIAYINH